MEGHSKMPVIHKSHYRRFVAIVLLTLLFTPIAVYSGGAEKAAEYKNAHFGADLVGALATMESDSRISVIVEFPDGTSTDEMVEKIRVAGLESVQIRYAFHLIPMVSLSIRCDEIQRLAEVSLIEEITLNQKRQILDVTVPQENYILADNGDGYVHFDSILGADLMWAEGYNGTGTTIAVLDSGAWGNHPDLQDRLIGFKDLINGQDDMNPVGGIDAYDDNGHGTACAWNAVGDGTASGGNLMGVAPGANLLVIKVLDSSGAGDDDVIAQGIEFAVEQNVDVISISLGGEWADSAFIVEPSIREIEVAVAADISVAVAAGNSGPAAFTINAPGVAEKAVTVGSSFGDTGIVAFSSVGPVLRTSSDPVGYTAKPDVVAPGNLVVSGRGNNVIGSEYPVYNSSQFGTSYTRWSGTSASTPMIAGLIALLTQKHLSLTPIEAKAALMSTATDLSGDPMSQGWGLANVSRASQLLVSSSWDITLMTPRSLPTLPGSSQVLIVGDERPPQNVTIISTQSVGLVNITISGNASQFVETNVDQLSVTTGYSYFGIELLVPEDVPLSAAGQYTGHLNLTQGSDVIASIDIMYTITLFGGRMMVDMEHHSGGTGGDVDDPSYYGYFTEYLREQGMVVSEFGDAEDLTTSFIDLSTISSADVFTIMDTEISHSPNEVSAIHSFVENGGTLLVFSEFYDQDTGEASFAFDDYNVILEPFGIQCEARSIGVGIDGFGLVYGANYSGYVETDPLMDGVNDLYVVQGSTLHVDPSVSNARGLFWEDAGRTHAIVATAEYGRGQVYVISDGSTLYDNILFDAINADADNLRLLRNLANAIIPEAPRIFDVELNVGEFGQEANVTAFIFDDDLESVSMSVIGPSGVNLTGTILEEFGYRFSTSFIFNSGGFFSIQVEATDSSGNVRFFQKTILVPVDAADDMVILTIIYVLLGVVGIGLGYVLLTRIQGRPKRPRRDVEPQQAEDEWELPPPSIE
ncbi:MAG: S8 family serine peptidase [Candidatus Thorarchaeota archaeon]|jgi:subtilisin family serine protease